MKKVGNHKSISRIITLSLAFVLSISLSSFAQDAAPVAAATAAPAAGGDAVQGKALFNANCAACHKLDSKMTGPALRGVSARHDKEWLHNWVKNSKAMISAGDPEAVKVFEENNKVAMTAFPQLSAADVDNIIAYTDEPAPVAEKPLPAGGQTAASGGLSNELILGLLAVVLGVLVTMLFMVNNVLTKIAKKNGVEVAEKPKSLPIWKAFAQNQFLILVSVIIMMLSGAYFAYGYFMQVGVDKGYAPIQPIHYSHKIHAGENGIDCKYCHSSARVSKTSGVPSLNVCMNCHKNISEFTGSKDSVYVDYTKEFYTAEIQKLYDAVGWDKTTQKYTGKTKPVKWVRVHNLPDFVYFNHSQHVSVAGVECQTCHGPVETMEILTQHSPLTMGWCINCHRETNVKVEGNDYYKKIHEELSKKYGVDKLTAAQMGGLECGKCHY
ncbi:c-type cytochrome [Flavobacterium sp.]|uniref:c-type cytochrome n=1 Tax=Flavobacterium sp. TaxID=239 RepID=UPI0026272A10|nr:c-type cytochrome [Flavobacterium sp.]